MAIRTFEWEVTRRGVGKDGSRGWDSTPEGEWEETELKVGWLLAVTLEAQPGRVR
ncbi:MAG: hypothetical protein ACRD29_19060 [Acidimicrobiales bacterium]